MNQNNDLEKARAQMRNAQVTPPEELPEDQPRMPQGPATSHQSEMVEEDSMSNIPTGGEVTVMDFMQATRSIHYIDMPWPSKGKTVKIKKFCKGELDKISAPFFQKTLKLDLTQFGGQGGKSTPMNFDISMELFGEMEKNMVELGLSFYKDNKGNPIINRKYIDEFMSSEDYQELSGIIQKVNPSALMTNVKQQEQVQEVKNS
jgi:hypothetical protein